ncbi:AraC family transcriptional regulator [Methylobacterium sp. WL103]|nr:AraC family transcriptional regulator [Methylobacterium sp. WL103]
MTRLAQRDPSAWRAQERFVARLGSPRQLQVFNDRGGIAVNFDIMRSVMPDITIVASQSASFSLWETTSSSGFITKPKFNAELVTIRFVTNGCITYRDRSGEALGTPTHTTLVGFEDLREVRASAGFSALSATISVEALAARPTKLSRAAAATDCSRSAPVAELTAPGMQALFCSLRQIYAQSPGVHPHGDLIIPLIREIFSYQLLSAWPKRDTPVPHATLDAPARTVRAALDYIEAHLSAPLTLPDIAAAAGLSVRSLQDKFRQAVGQTPVQYIIDSRLRRVHQDLLSDNNAMHSIAEIAVRWGFVHMSDFGPRYRRLYGRAPSETRRDADRRT